MSKVLERPAEELHTESPVEGSELPPLETAERPVEFQPTPVKEPSRFVRWMGWLIGAVLVIGIGGLVWWNETQPEEVAGSEVLSTFEGWRLFGSAPIETTDQATFQDWQLFGSAPIETTDQATFQDWQLFGSAPIEDFTSESR